MFILSSAGDQYSQVTNSWDDDLSIYSYRELSVVLLSTRILMTMVPGLDVAKTTMESPRFASSADNFRATFFLAAVVEVAAVFSAEIMNVVMVSAKVAAAVVTAMVAAVLAVSVVSAVWAVEVVLVAAVTAVAAVAAVAAVTAAAESAEESGTATGFRNLSPLRVTKDSVI